MSYTKRTDVPCQPGELVVALDAGELVAAQCPASRDEQSNRMVFAPAARWIDASGAARCDSSGRPVSTALTHTMAPADVDRLTAAAVVRECLFLVLGEPLTPDPDHPEVTLIPWSADTVAQRSIRNAIASANVSAPTASEIL